MEEARQYPALTTAQWVLAIAMVARLTCCLGIIICAFVDHRAILPLALGFCLSAGVTGIVNLVQMLRQGKVRWFKKIFLRADRPVHYWMAVATCVAGLGVTTALSGLIVQIGLICRIFWHDH